MRIFWGLILVLMLGAGGFLYGKLGRTDQAVTQSIEAEPRPVVSLPSTAQAPAQNLPPFPSKAVESSAALPAESVQNVQPDPMLDSQALDAMLGTTPDAVPPPTQEEPARPPVPPKSDPEPSAPDETPAAEASEELPPPMKQTPAVPAPPTSAPEGVPTAAKPATFAGYELIPATRTTKDDGSLLLDDHYIVKGKGTEAEPYKITWDLLTSSSDTLAPRQGKKKLPERITMLDGQWVELSGYIAFPLMVQEADELLLMLNQWDGCCIGVPPTPYDAIEVSLVKAVKGQDRFAVQGSLKGKLGVKPHLVGEWLVGIYVMDQATLSTKAIGGISQ